MVATLDTSKSRVVIFVLAFRLLAKTLPVKSTLVPVAAPIFGVVRFAEALTTTLPPLISVVLLSTLTENVVPVKVKPLPA